MVRRSTRLGWLVAVISGLLAGWIVGGGVASWSDDGPGGSVLAEWIVGLAAGGVVFLVVASLAARMGDRRLFGPARRPAGGLGQESASTEPQPRS